MRDSYHASEFGSGNLISILRVRRREQPSMRYSIPSVIERTLIGSIPFSLILTILFMMPELLNLLNNIDLYLGTIVFGGITLYLFILEIFYFYYIIRSGSEYKTQTEKILKLGNIKTGYLAANFTEKTD